MGLFDKLKKMVGLSGIKVDLVLERNIYKQGETISGVVKITGGPEAKMANKLSVVLVESYPEITLQTTTQPATSQPNDPGEELQAAPQTQVTTETLSARMLTFPEVILAQHFQIGPQAQLEYPVSLTLPPFAAVTGPCQQWHLKTHLDIQGALDAADNDAIVVSPNDDMQAVREAICNAASFPTSALLRLEAFDSSGERISKRVYYL
jgi:sporulation-control protein